MTESTVIEQLENAEAEIRQLKKHLQKWKFDYSNLVESASRSNLELKNEVLSLQSKLDETIKEKEFIRDLGDRYFKDCCTFLEEIERLKFGIGMAEDIVADLRAKLDEIESQEPVAEIINFRGSRKIRYLNAFKNVKAGDKLYLHL